MFWLIIFIYGLEYLSAWLYLFAPTVLSSFFHVHLSLVKVTGRGCFFIFFSSPSRSASFVAIPVDSVRRRRCALLPSSCWGPIDGNCFFGRRFAPTSRWEPSCVDVLLDPLISVPPFRAYSDWVVYTPTFVLSWFPFVRPFYLRLPFYQNLGMTRSTTSESLST